MRMSGRLGWLVCAAAWMAGAAGALAPSSAAAQGRDAAIKALATVRGVHASAVLGAHPVTAAQPPRSDGAALTADAWRITSGQGGALRIRVEGGTSVSICEELVGTTTRCEPYRAPRIEAGGDGGPSGFLVRVDPAPPVPDGPVLPVRVTVAFIDF